MKINKKRIIIISLIVFDVIAIVIGIYIYRQNNKVNTDDKIETVHQSPEAAALVQDEATQMSEASPTTAPYDMLDGKVKLSQYIDVTVAEDARIEELPEKINIYDSQPMYLDDETGAGFISNLEEGGWLGNQFESTDIEGLYFIGTKENSEIITETQEYVASVREFMNVSGLLDYFEQEGIELTEEIQGEGKDCTVFYWLMAEGQKTGGYVRVNVETGNNCTECKMYLLKSTVIYTLPSISLEEALENAYINPDEDFEGRSFSALKADLKYFNGIPHFGCFILNPETQLCRTYHIPAVSYDTIMADEILHAKYTGTLE